MCRWKPQAIAKADAATALIALRERLDDLTEMDQVEVKKVISMLYEAFHGDEAEDISIVARNAYDILLNAMKATASEKAQETSGTTRPLPKDKGNTYVTRRRKN
ncbi:hypothetical protein LguiA_026687 [Lonicera macranthoides]